ncbi:MAG TPA: carboxymuconolactone decarboxylase family protein [Deltaproteobacteria bacterium]|jgi:alkylhydroperoxidase family enzyme|nr:carboxymuconolactone decarboxylase family protein [Candidatus Binatota bacterium]HIL13092.1 carboxymuconolactone decarboxylase family protein [Deltaproteobacteria bacterium]
MARINVPEGDGEEIPRLFSLNPDMFGAVATFSTAVYDKTRLPVRVREFARMRVAQINDCGV